VLEPALPADEQERLQDLQCLSILDTKPEARFDRITRTAQRLFRVPIALLSLVDSDRQWFKSRRGLGATQTPRSISFCGHAILQEGVFVVCDAAADARFKDNPLVTDGPAIRFYAGAPLRAPSGRRVGTLCIIDTAPREWTSEDAAGLTDLAEWTEQELANIELARAVSALEAELAGKREFVSMIAHEVRTPVTVLRAALGLIAADKRMSLSPSGPDIFAMASRNADRLSSLLDSFLEIERLDHGVVALQPAPHRFRALVEQAMQLEQLHAQACGVSLILQWPRTEESIVVVMDAARFEQILSQLLSNAVKHSERGQDVEVVFERADSRVRIAVRDHGPGIPDSFRPRLFQRFAQVDMSDSRPRNGAGLGLAISKELAELMGGTIDVECPPAGGSTFRIELPLGGTSPPVTAPVLRAQ
jgi:signal transduction histidine kinase